MEKAEKKGGNVFAIATMFALFFMIAFVTNFASSMGVIAKAQFNASNALSQLGNFANFFAYLFMGIPGGLILKRKGYKFTSLTAVAVGFTGVGIQLLSGYIGSFMVYVLGAFIAGFSMCMLNLVTNPLLNTLGGGGNKGNQLVQFGCSLNSVGATLSPMVLGWLIGEITKDTAFSDAAPALMIAMGIFLLAFFVVLCSSIPEPHMETAEEKAARLAGGNSVFKDVVATLKFPHFTLGAVAIFFYIVIEVGIPAMALNYMTEINTVKEETGEVAVAEEKIKAEKDIEEKAQAEAKEKGIEYKKPARKPCEEFVEFSTVEEGGKKVGKKTTKKTGVGFVGPVIAGSVAAAYWFLMMIGRLLGAAVGAKVSSRAMITCCSVVGIGLMLATMFVPVQMVTVFGKSFPLSMCFMALCGLCTSVMWGGIFNMAAEGLGKYVPMGSGIFMAMVFGGVLVPVQGLLADKIGILNSYWMTIGLLAYVLFYALVGSRLGRKNG
jgi:FHS family L-fucose permease-like MFS transporter